MVAACASLLLSVHCMALHLYRAKIHWTLIGGHTALLTQWFITTYLIYQHFRSNHRVPIRAHIFADTYRLLLLFVWCLDERAYIKLNWHRIHSRRQTDFVLFFCVRGIKEMKNKRRLQCVFFFIYASFVHRSLRRYCRLRLRQDRSRPLLLETTQNFLSL